MTKDQSNILALKFKARNFNSIFVSLSRALYNGIIPGLQRQMAFSAIRIGAYESVKQKYIQMSGVESPMGHLAVRIAAGVTTGTIAILSAQPTDVVKIRMQAELRKAGEKPRYNGVMQAYRNVYQVEGWTGLYKGTSHHIYVLDTTGFHSAFHHKREYIT